MDLGHDHGSLTREQTNVKGAMICTKRFQPTAHPTRAAVIGMTAGMMLPPSMIAGLSAYMSSKIAAVKVLEFFGAENPGIFVASVLPGIMETEMFNKSNLPADQLPLDDSKEYSPQNPNWDFCIPRLTGTLYSPPPGRLHRVAVQSGGVVPRWTAGVGALGRGGAASPERRDHLGHAVDGGDPWVAASVWESHGSESAGLGL